MSPAESPQKGLVSDTLDLAERARVAVNALTGMLDTEHGYKTPGRVRYYQSPPIMSCEEGAKVCWNGHAM